VVNISINALLSEEKYDFISEKNKAFMKREMAQLNEG
jgi:hypothetical protein